jgi:isopropylmalate/homocitrate/citramalate synthase
VLLTVAAATLATTGCGGSTEAEQSTSSRSDSAASRLIARADVICKQLNIKLAPTQPRVGTIALAQSSLQHATLEKRAITELGEIVPPASFELQWKQMIRYRRALAEALAQFAADAKADNVKAMHALAASKSRMHQTLARTASHDGFKDCSQVG